MRTVWWWGAAMACGTGWREEERPIDGLGRERSEFSTLIFPFSRAGQRLHKFSTHKNDMASGGLFRKFSLDDVSTQNNVKSSVQRAIRGKKKEEEQSGAAATKGMGVPSCSRTTPARPDFNARACDQYPPL